MTQQTSYTRAALYARVSSDRQDVGPVRLRTAAGAQGPRTEERLHRRPRVRGRGRERAHRRPSPSSVR